MKVIWLVPQKHLITSGPYRFSRNPLYLGGNVFIFFGAASLLGSPTGLFITAIHLPFVDLFIPREEKQLEKDFGEEWVRYKGRCAGGFDAMHNSFDYRPGRPRPVRFAPAGKA